MNICLAFFDTRIPATTKMAMISALEEQGTDSAPLRIKIDVADIPTKNYPTLLPEILDIFSAS